MSSRSYWSVWGFSNTLTNLVEEIHIPPKYVLIFYKKNVDHNSDIKIKKIDIEYNIVIYLASSFFRLWIFFHSILVQNRVKKNIINKLTYLPGK